MSAVVSVILPVYNGEKYLEEAINSILGQTFQEFELLIIIDGSPDNSLMVAQQFNDSRLKIFVNSTNLGLISTLNKGIDLSEGKFIARMDQDDISLPDRLKKQVEFLMLHEEIDILGTSFLEFGENEELRKMPETHEEIDILHFFRNPLCHPSVMMRSSSIKEKFNLRYSSQFKNTEDWAMWHQCITSGLKIHNLPDILLRYRIAGQSTTPQQREIKRPQFKKIYQLILPKLFDDEAIDYVDIHYAINFFEIVEFKGSQLANYFLLLESALISKGFSKNIINSILDNLSHRIFCKLADRSARSAVVFMLKTRTSTQKKVKYLFSAKR